MREGQQPEEKLKTRNKRMGERKEKEEEGYCAVFVLEQKRN